MAALKSASSGSAKKSFYGEWLLPPIMIQLVALGFSLFFMVMHRKSSAPFSVAVINGFLVVPVNGFCPETRSAHLMIYVISTT